jgi:hypothetical protein
MMIAVALDEDADVRIGLQNSWDKYQISKNNENITMFKAVLARRRAMEKSMEYVS